MCLIKHACKTNNYKLIKLIISFGNINLKDTDRTTPLFLLTIACNANSLQAIQTLVDAGLDVNAEGGLPLHTCKTHGYEQIESYMRSKGCIEYKTMEPVCVELNKLFNMLVVQSLDHHTATDSIVYWSILNDNTEMLHKLTTIGYDMLMIRDEHITIARELGNYHVLRFINKHTLGMIPIHLPDIT